MKTHKLAAAAAALSLALGLSAPAMAAEAADARLTKVTQTVKTTLDVSDEYTEFYGEPNETLLGTKWELSWSAEGKNLNVSASEEGKVLSMNRWETSSDPVRNSFGPTFPATTMEEARTIAEAFLKTVLSEGETAVFQDSRMGAARLNASSYTFYGSIELNGLPSPLTFSIRVRTNDGAVTSFYRDDPSQYVGDVPAPESATTAQKAAELLKDTLDLRLEYVLDGESKTAVLRYLPEDRDDFYVDAATGKLVNLTELRAALREGGDVTMNLMSGGAAPEDAAEDAMAQKRLTEAELAGVAKLEGVLDQAGLDRAVAKWKALGLSGFDLAECSYSVDRDTGDVTARLSYVKKTDDGVSRRTVTADAKTGALQSMSGYDPYLAEAKVKVTEEQAQAKAEAFLKELWPTQFGKTQLYRSTSAENGSRAHSFTFAHKVNGYFFPGNSITVRVSAADGSITGFSKSFDDAVTFDSADGLISQEKALDVWAASFPVELAYITVPVKLDLLGREVEPLVKAGYSYYNALKPGYELGDREVWYSGVDAKTGELVSAPTSETRTMTYDDLDGHWAQAAMTELAQYNVGWLGGKADPDGALTQLACVALLSSADGYTYDPAEEGAADALYDYAVSRGLLTREERSDAKVLTRSETVKLLLDSLGFREVAQLKGIFRCDFADAAHISEADLSYAALAQGLGIVDGDEGLNYAAARPAARAEAAVMLWRAMKR